MKAEHRFIRKLWLFYFSVSLIFTFAGCSSTSMRIESDELKEKEPGHLTGPDSLELLYDLEIYGGMSTDPFTVRGDILFISDLSGRVYAYNLADGKGRGVITIKNSSVISAPLIRGNEVITAAVLKNREVTEILTYDFTRNKEISSYEIEDTGIRLMNIGGVPHILCRSGYFYQIGDTSKFRLGRDITASYVDEQIIITSGERGSIYVMNPGKPEDKRHFSIADDIISGITYSEGMIYTVSDDLILRKTDPLSGETVTKRKLETRTVSAPVISSDGRIIIADLSGRISVFSDTEGFPPVITRETGGMISSAPLITGNRILVMNQDKKIEILTADNLEEINILKSDERFKTNGILHKGMLITGTGKALVKVYKLLP